MIKFFANGITLGLHLLNFYTDPPLAVLINLFSDSRNRYRVLLPYKEELVPPEYRIFDQLGGFDVFNLLVGPRHMSMWYNNSMKIQILRFLYEDSNGRLRLIRIYVMFDSGYVFVLVNKPYNLQDGDHYFGLVSPDGSPNQELVKILEQFMKMSISL